MLELFLATRYLRQKHKINFISIISTLSALGITIGVAALIIVLSVFNGFGSIVTNTLVNFDPHIKISILSEDHKDEEHLISLLKTNKHITTFYPYVEGKAIIQHGAGYSVISIKGISKDPGDLSWGLSGSIITGSLGINKGYRDRILLGIPVALKLSSRLNDSLNVTSFSSIERSITDFSIPRTSRLCLSGVFETNNKDYDQSCGFTSLEAAGEILGSEGVPGYELRLDDISRSQEVKADLEGHLDKNKYSIKTWYDLHKQLYSVMLLEREGAYVLLALIIAVATFNILGSLTMTVIEKKKDIGILRSMGMNNRSISRLFMFQGILLGLIGTVCGVLIGFLVCYLQMKFKFYRMDPMKYIIDAIPVEMRVSDLISISLMSFSLTFLASLYPARRALKTSVIDSIKWE